MGCYFLDPGKKKKKTHGKLTQGIKKTINKSKNTKLHNPWWTIGLHWTRPYECPGWGVLWGWHRCAAYKGSRQQDKLEEAWKLSPWFFKYALGPWISTASLRVSEAASQSPMPGPWGTKVWVGCSSMAQRSLKNQHKLCCVFAELLSCVQHFATPWTIAWQAPVAILILQARIPDWVSMPSSWGSFQLWYRTQVSHIAGGFFTAWVNREC